ncbi:MAG TPA: polysaccharide biosynthesis/export family protein, partial [Rhizomicrobium sp.]
MKIQRRTKRRTAACGGWHITQRHSFFFVLGICVALLPNLALSQPAPLSQMGSDSGASQSDTGVEPPNPSTPAPSGNPYEASGAFNPTTIQSLPASPDTGQMPVSDRTSTNALHQLPQQGEFEKFVAQTLGQPLARFGSSLFMKGAQGFAPGATTTVPPDYALNPGDELLVGVTGSVDAPNLRLIVDNDGRIFVPHVGAINVAGVRY